MGPASRPLPSDPATSSPSEPPPASERSIGPRRPDSRVMERRLPNPRDTMQTLPEGETFDFEPHDTIPAPPWLDLDDEIAPTQKAP